MKNVKMIFAVVITGMLLSTQLFAMEPMWKKEKLTDQQWKESYFLKLADGECRIFVSRDGREISVIARDNNFNGQTIEQAVVINSARHVVIKTWQARVYRDGIATDEYVKAYDIFSVKFLAYARKLPKNILAKFDNTWGPR